MSNDKMDNLINSVQQLKNSKVKEVIDSRMKEFSELGQQSDNEIFKELCFCLLTANFSAQGGIKIQSGIGDGFHNLSKEELAQKLAQLGHRFPNKRAEFIVAARNSFKKIDISDKNIRDLLVNNIKGLGMKEASHFLRNIGFRDYAIVDFHIVDILVKNNLIEKPKNNSLTAKKYLEIESVLRELADRLQMPLGELDLYLWFLETGKVLK